MISDQEIRKFIKNGVIDDILVFDSIDSTNTEAKRRAKALFESGKRSPCLFVAREQSAGRGRLGRSFYSPKQKGIYTSILYFSDKPVSQIVTATTSAAVTVARSIELLSGREMKIKWVNDIYDDSGKVSGILAESVSLGDYTAIVIGVGINVGESDFPEELRGIASSVKELEGRESELIAAIADGLVEQIDGEDRGYMEEYCKRFMLEGLTVDLLRAGEIVAHGRVLGVDDEGGLIFLPDGESNAVVISSGEVSVRNFKKE